MKKILITLCTLAISIVSNAQETIQIKKNSGKFGDLEIYNVLKSDKKVKHGQYEKYLKYFTADMTKGKILTERGQFNNGKKTGIWTFYWSEDIITAKGSYENDLRTGNWEYFKNSEVIEKGNYLNDKRDGLWIYFEKQKGIIEKGNYKDGNKVGRWTYHYSNIPVQIYDHTVDSLIQFYDDKTEWEAVIDSSNKVVKVMLSRPPQYVGYKRQLHNDMSVLTKYPDEARRMGIDGKVVVTFMVNENGTTSNFSIIQDNDNNFGGNCGKAVIDAFKANTVKWKPGIYNGKKVKVKLYQTVIFKLIIDPVTGLGQTEIEYM